jgi:hypothetical protein
VSPENALDRLDSMRIDRDRKAAIRYG